VCTPCFCLKPLNPPSAPIRSLDRKPLNMGIAELDKQNLWPHAGGSGKNPGRRTGGRHASVGGGRIRGGKPLGGESRRCCSRGVALSSPPPSSPFSLLATLSPPCNLGAACVGHSLATLSATSPADGSLQRRRSRSQPHPWCSWLPKERDPA
jgi:hypothetical protein